MKIKIQIAILICSIISLIYIIQPIYKPVLYTDGSTLDTEFQILVRNKNNIPIKDAQLLVYTKSFFIFDKKSFYLPILEFTEKNFPKTDKSGIIKVSHKHIRTYKNYFIIFGINSSSSNYDMFSNIKIEIKANNYNSNFFKYTDLFKNCDIIKYLKNRKPGDKLFCKYEIILKEKI